MFTVEMCIFRLEKDDLWYTCTIKVSSLWASQGLLGQTLNFMLNLNQMVCVGSHWNYDHKETQ